MRAAVTFLAPDSGSRPRRQTVEAEVLHIGREAETEIQLADPRIAQRHALIERSPLGLMLRAVGSATLGEGGGNPERVVLIPGLRVGIGPYRLSVGPAAEGFDLDLTLELLQPLADEPELAVKRLQDSLSSWLPSTRLLSWAGALLVLLLAISFPLAGWMSARPTPYAPMANATLAEDGIFGSLPVRVLARLWSVGSMSNAHRSFGTQCAICHERPFSAVANESCLNCHQYVTQHADPHLFPVVDVARQSCEDCHLEHKGEQPAIRKDQGFCVSCHGDLHESVARSRLANVPSFARHPEFRAQVVADAGKGTLRRVALDARLPPTNNGNLIFSHAAHLDPKGILSPDGVITLDCVSCHLPEPGGAAMQPIRMEQQCQSCHDLRFEPRHPEWVLPHGKPERVVEMIRSHYSQMALAGEAIGIPRDGLVMRPGAPGPSEALAAAWAHDRTAEVLGSTFSKSACGLCHKVEPPAAGEDALAWKVAPVMVPTRFFPKARFSHAAHATQPCGQCHNAREATEDSALQLPSIAICRNCHADEGSAATRVASPCSTCHAFHGPESWMPKILDRQKVTP